MKAKVKEREGDIIQRPALARILETLAMRGSAALYNGRIGLFLVRFVQEKGGVMTIEDLESYRATVAEIIRLSWQGREVVSCLSPCR